MTYDLGGRALRPLGNLLSLAELPLMEVLPAEAAASVFEGLYYTEAEVWLDGADAVLNLWLAFDGELALSLPGIDVVEVVLGAAGAGWTAVQARIVVGPGATMSLVDVPVTIRVDRELLQPMLTPDEPDPDAAATEIPLGLITLSASTDGLHLQAGVSATLPLCQVAGTGVVLEAGTIRWLTPDLAEAPVYGAPPDFTGIHIDGARVHLPDVNFLPDTVQLTGCFIGTGGLTGSVAALGEITWDQGTEAYSGDMAGELLGFPCGLTRIELEFVQSSLVQGSVAGELYLPFLDRRIGVDLELGMAGELTLALAGPRATNPDPDVEERDGLLSLHLEGVADVELDAAAISKDGEVVTVLLSGRITPLPAGLDWPTVEVQGLAIGSDGSVHLEGGWLDLPSQAALDFHGFQIEITRIGLGASADGGRWIGFSGGFNLVGGLPAGASVEGLRILWYDDGRPVRISLEGVGVELSLPNVLRFQGAVSYRELEAGGETVHRFDGAISLDLLALSITIDGALVIGSASGDEGTYTYTFLAVYLDAQLPAGIPLWATGLALYGVGGLFALNMEPGKLPPEPWYGTGPDDGWYKRAPTGVTDLATKWINRSGSLAVGGGITIGTVADNGFSFNGKVLLVITLPGPIILLEGRAGVLQERTGLDEEPDFTALAVLDGRAGTFLVGVDAGYRYGDGGELIDIHAGVEAFFSLADAGAWHLYIGQKDPRERRVRASTLDLFEADAYLMLDARQVATGASIGYDEDWKFGPVRVSLEAWIEAGAVLSWKPAHLSGDLWLHGGARVTVAGFGIGISCDARFSSDVFDPFHLVADLDIAVELPWPVPDFEAGITLEWGPRPDPPPLPLPLKEVAVGHLKTTTNWPLPRSGTPALVLPDWDPDDDGFLDDASAAVPAQLAAQPPGNLPVVPMDCRPRLTFSRPVHDDALVGVNAQPVIPERERLGDPARDQGPTRARYALREVALHRWDGSGWILEARKATTANPDGVADLYGSWANVPAMPDGAGQNPGQVKLWLWSATPFDWTWSSGSAWDDWFTEEYTTYPCVEPTVGGELCCDFEPVNPRVLLTSPWSSAATGIQIGWLAPRRQHVVELDTSTGSVRALCFPRKDGERDNIVTITLPVPAASLTATVIDGPVEALGVTASGAIIGPVDSASGQVTVAGEGLVRVLLRGIEQFCLVSVCATIPSDPQGEAWRLELAEHLQEETARWSQTGLVLPADTTFRLTVVTQVNTEDEPIGSGTVDVTELAYFRTGGPPGVGELSVPLGAANPDEFSSGLEDLTCYVRQTLPATVPAPGQQPLLPRPVYRAYDVGVEFNEDYVDLLYRLAGQRLGLFLYDTANRPVTGEDGQPLILDNPWGQAETVTLTEEERRWVCLGDTRGCFTIDTSTIPSDRTLAGPAATLAPDTVYEARLLPIPPRVDGDLEPVLAAAPLVYRFAFTTSRFATFAEHIASYPDETWQVELPSPDALAEASAVAVTMTAAPALPAEQEARGYEAVATAALGQQAWQNPATIEVTRVEADGDALAFLVRSPEPIAWDRTTLELERAELLTPPRPPAPRPPPGYRPVPTAAALRSRDGTGLAVTVPAATPAGTRLEPGRYRLRLTFQRDNRALDPTSPVLSQAGDSSDEVATIDIPWRVLISTPSAQRSISAPVLAPQTGHP